MVAFSSAGFFELDHAQGQAIDENHDVGPAVSAILDDGELIDGEPIVIIQVLKVEQPDLVVDLSIILHIGDIHSIGKHPMETPVVLDQAGRVGPHDFPDSLFNGIRRDVWVDVLERGLKVFRPRQPDHNLGVPAPDRQG